MYWILGVSRIDLHPCIFLLLVVLRRWIWLVGYFFGFGTARCGAFSCSFSSFCVWWILSGTVIISLGKRELITTFITKTRLYNFDPLKPHFYIVKLGFTGVYIIFHIFARKHRLWYWLEPPCRGGSNEYPQSLVSSRKRKIIRIFYPKILYFLVVKFSVYLNRLVFIMFL